MLKKLILILLLSKSYYQEEQEDPDLQKGIDLIKSYFKYLNKDVLSKNEAANALVLVFDEISFEDLDKIDQKEELDPAEEEIVSFKGYLKRYFDQNHLDEELNFELMVDILKQNFLLEFLQDEMEKEEKEVFNQEYEGEDELDFASLDDLKLLEDEGLIDDEELRNDL